MSRDEATSPAEPRTVLLLHSVGSAGIFEVRLAARGLCDVVVAFDSSDTELTADQRLQLEAGGAVDIPGFEPAGLLRLARSHRVTGVVTFAEKCIGAAAALSEALGLPGVGTKPAALLTDKGRQREALGALGVDAVRFAVAGTRSGIAAAAVEVEFPCVLKPVAAAASRDAYLLTDLDDLERVVSGLNAGSAGELAERYVVEEFLAGDSSVLGSFWGDYVSVETSVRDGCPRHLSVTGKLPLTEPFRETGIVSPVLMDAELTERCVTLTHQAVRTIGVRDGVTHTELKLTPRGPRIIEINGRVGGYVPGLLRRSTGFDIVRHALLLALNSVEAEAEAVQAIEGGSWQFLCFFPAPVGASRLVGSVGAELVENLPGVRQVVQVQPGGAVVSSRDGTRSYAGYVEGEAQDFDELRELVQRVYATMKYRWEAVPSS